MLCSSWREETPARRPGPHAAAGYRVRHPPRPRWRRRQVFPSTQAQLMARARPELLPGALSLQQARSAVEPAQSSGYRNLMQNTVQNFGGAHTFQFGFRAQQQTMLQNRLGHGADIVGTYEIAVTE